jgi:hypothetical protein
MVYKDKSIGACAQSCIRIKTQLKIGKTRRLWDGCDHASPSGFFGVERIGLFDSVDALFPFSFLKVIFFSRFFHSMSEEVPDFRRTYCDDELDTSLHSHRGDSQTLGPSVNSAAGQRIEDMMSQQSTIPQSDAAPNTSQQGHALLPRLSNASEVDELPFDRLLSSGPGKQKSEEMLNLALSNRSIATSKKHSDYLEPNLIRKNPEFRPKEMVLTASISGKQLSSRSWLPFSYFTPARNKNVDFNRQSWGRSRVAPYNGRGRSILITPQEKADLAERRTKSKRLRKVHFNLPKTNGSRRVVAQALDPKSPTVRRWQSIMLLPLCYELWAFPYRLALGAPSTASTIFAADLACDSLFILDIFVALCTALPPAQPGEAPVTSFFGIARHYFAVNFPAEFLPCALYWVATPICAHYLAQLCPDPTPDTGHTRRTYAGKSPWEGYASVPGSGNHTPAAASGWECVVSSSRQWPVWAWWLATIPRILPRAIRLRYYFKAMESDLVRRSCSPLPPPLTHPAPPLPVRPSRARRATERSFF